MPIPAEKLTQLTAAYNYTAVLCLVTGDLSTYTITADAGTDVITATGHDFINGTPVQFTNSGGALPSGIAADTTYFVIGAAANTFQISETIGGSAVDVTSAGSGTNTVTEVAIADEINQYTDAELAWDIMEAVYLILYYT